MKSVTFSFWKGSLPDWTQEERGGAVPVLGAGRQEAQGCGFGSLKGADGDGGARVLAASGSDPPAQVSLTRPHKAMRKRRT